MFMGMDKIVWWKGKLSKIVLLFFAQYVYTITGKNMLTGEKLYFFVE